MTTKITVICEEGSVNGIDITAESKEGLGYTTHIKSGDKAENLYVHSAQILKIVERLD